jgi:hypothetical protein
MNAPLNRSGMPPSTVRVTTPSTGKSPPSHPSSGSRGPQSPAVSQQRSSISGLDPIRRPPSMSMKPTGKAGAEGMNAAGIMDAAQTALQFAEQGKHIYEGLFGNKAKTAESPAPSTETPAKLKEETTAAEHSEIGKPAEEHAETAEAKTKPERFFAGSKLEGTVGFLRKINPVLSHAMTKAEEARANGDNVAVGALKGYGQGIYGAVKGVASGVTTAMSTGLAVETLNPIGLAALVGGSAYAGASKNSEDAPDIVKNLANKLV